MAAQLSSVHAYKNLGFKENPFHTSADPRFLYLSSQHQLVLETIQRIVDTHQGLAVVEGDVGVGKSTIARRLFEIYSPQDMYHTLYIHTASYTTPFEALSDIAEKFGIPQRRSESALRNKFEAWLVEQRRQEITPVLILDDAQMLAPKSLETLHYLYNFDYREKLLQVILFGQTEVRELLAQNAALLSRVVSWQTILPLPAGEALSMISFRCQVAGRVEPLLSEAAFYRLYEYSRGIPRTIVVICGEVLHLLDQRGKQVADEAIVNEAMENYQNRPDHQLLQTTASEKPGTKPNGKRPTGRPLKSKPTSANSSKAHRPRTRKMSKP